MKAKVKLSKTQQALLDAMASGVTCIYMRYAGSFNPVAYYYRSDNHARCTAAAIALFEKGLVEKFDELRFGDCKLRIKR